VYIAESKIEPGLKGNQFLPEYLSSSENSMKTAILCGHI
jgi:hypothetical protein